MFSRMKSLSCFAVCLMIFCAPTHRAWSDESPVSAASASPAPATTNASESKLPVASNANEGISSFQQGVKEYQAKDFAKAESSFQAALLSASAKTSSESTVNKDAILTNLALAQYQLQKSGWALANLRKALLINPENATAKEAHEFIWSKLAVKEIPHQIDYYEVVRKDFVSPISTFFTELFFAICLFSFAWQVLNLLGARKAAKANQQALPNPELRHLFMLFALVISFLFFAVKKYDASLSRGTVVASKVSATVSPGDDQVALFDLYEGFEVIVISRKDDYVQVNYPGGGTGWIAAKNLSLDSEVGSH